MAVIGDSTFFHTGIPALLNVAYNKANIMTIILDNRTTAMTGHQDNPGTGQTLQRQATEASRSSRWCARSASSTWRRSTRTTSRAPRGLSRS